MIIKMVEAAKTFFKSIEPSLKRVPELFIVGLIVMGLQWLHAEQLHQLRIDFLKPSIEQATALKDIAQSLGQHTESQLRCVILLESLIREINNKKV